MKKTLLEIAGTEEKKIDWNNCNLLVIDMQKQYFTNELDLKEEGLNALNKAKKVLNLARSRSVNIFHIVHVASNESVLFNPSSDNIQIMDEVKPNKNETIIKKTMPNSFFKTELYDLLSLTEKKQLCIMGFASHMCVTATALSAFELGFENFILNDCCATRDLPLFDGVVKSRNLHKASLALLGDRYATIIQSSSSLA